MIFWTRHTSHFKWLLFFPPVKSRKCQAFKILNTFRNLHFKFNSNLSPQLPNTPFHVDGILCHAYLKTNSPQTPVTTNTSNKTKKKNPKKQTHKNTSFLSKSRGKECFSTNKENDPSQKNLYVPLLEQDSWPVYSDVFTKQRPVQKLHTIHLDRFLLHFAYWWNSSIYKVLYIKKLWIWPGCPLIHLWKSDI